MGIGTTELLLILAIVLLIFGATRLPAVMGGLGKGIREFKKALKGDDEAIVSQLKAGVGKQVRFLSDGTIEVGVENGATLVEVSEGWAVVRGESGTEKIPLVAVKKIVVRT